MTDRDCKHGTLARQCDRCEMEAEIAALRETHKALHRRCQQAESALVTYRKLTALPPDGDGARFVSGSMGRAMLVWLCDSQQAEIADLRHDIERQHEACSEHLSEGERLRAFVAAFDEWHIADYVADGTETYAAMLAAREAVGATEPRP